MAFFIDGEFKTTLDFYTKERDEQMKCKESFVNMLMLYSLTPGSTSAFRELRLCENLCEGTQESVMPLSYLRNYELDGNQTSEVVQLSDPTLVFELA